MCIRDSATAAPTAVQQPNTTVSTPTPGAADGSGFGFGSTPPKKATTTVEPSAKKASPTAVPKAATPLAVTGGEARPVVAYGLLLLVAGFGLATLGRRLRLGD